MKMTRRIFMMALLLSLVAMIALPGCSDTQRKWCERGQDGIVKAKANTTGRYEQALAAEDKKLENLIAAGFRDIKAMRDGQIAGSDGKPLEMSNKWLTEHEAGVKMAFKLWLERRAALRQQYDADMANLNSVGEAFVNIEKLNRAWANSEQDMAASIDRLTAEILEMKTQQANAATTTSVASE